MSRVIFQSEFDPLPRKTSLRALTAFVATVMVGTAVAVYGFVESTSSRCAVRPVAETQVLEPPSWMQEEAAPQQRTSTASRRRTTLHTTCPIVGPAEVSFSSRSCETPTQIVPTVSPMGATAGAAAGSPAGLSGSSSGS